MKEKISEIIPLEERCDVCKSRKATKLCDYVIGKSLKTFKYLTCDTKLCDECATKIMFEKEICPKHKKKLIEELV